MRKRMGRSILAAVGFAAVMGLGITTSVSTQTQAERPLRTADGKPNLTGIWQVMNTANWDIQAHEARQGPVIALGAAFSIPPGPGRGRGQRDSLSAVGGGEKEGKRRQLDGARPRGQVLHAGHPTRHLHAVPLPDRPVVEHDPDGVRVHQRQPHHPHEQQGAEPGPVMDGLVALGAGRATRWSST